MGTVTGELHLGSLAAGAAPFSAGGGPTVRANGASNSSGSAAASNSSGGAAASSTNSTTQVHPVYSLYSYKRTKTDLAEGALRGRRGGGSEEARARYSVYLPY